MRTDETLNPLPASGWRTTWARFAPQQEDLSPEDFHLRLRLCLAALAATTAIVAIVGLIRGESPLNIAAETLPIVGMLVVAQRSPHRLISMLCVSLGLASNSAILVHYTDGRTEAHFAFFVVLALIALFQDWRASTAATVLVLAHHVIFGLTNPSSVYNDQAAQENPLFWGAIHGSFVLVFAATLMLLWQFSAQEHRATRRALNALTAAQDEIEYRALHDPLTHLGNRALLLNELELALAAGEAVGLYVIDIDHFRLVNESLGHDIGDQLLIAVADRLRASTRRTDVLVHIGADEFAVMSRNDAGHKRLTTKGQGFLADFRRPMLIDGEAFPLSISIGAATSRGSEQQKITDPKRLLRNANAAMSQAKAAGRNGVAIFDEVIHTQTSQRHELKKELHQAVADGAFELFYQPIFSLASGDLIGVEALIRWRHPHRGLVSPDDFIPVAEDTGVIIPIGEWVLWEACMQIVTWQQRHGIELEVAINLSARQLVSRTLIATVSDVLETTGIDPSRVCFEITESALIDNPELAIGNMQALRDLGLGLALDDFGTRYASLTYLRTLPVTMIKIDRSFTAGLGVDPKDDTIIESTIALAHGLGLQVVAEGIERADQYRTLESFHCDFGQGYHLGRPMPADDMIEAFFARVS